MKISVALCTYNGAPFLREQLDSIAQQTRIPDELIVSDDKSSDETPDIIADFSASAPFPVRFVVNEQNLGSTKNFERAIALCGGDVIALCDQDDFWLPEKLSRIEQVFAGEARVGIVFSDAEVVDENLRPLGYRLWDSVGFDDRSRRLVRDGRVLDVLLPGWTVTGATMAFRSTFKEMARDIPINLPLIHDGWIALMIASVAEVRFVEEPLIQYRQHSRQQIGAPERKPDSDAMGLKMNVKAAKLRTNDYFSMIAIGMVAMERLSKMREVRGYDQALVALGARILHLHTRASLPASKLSRLRSVVKELVSRRYHRYSSGFYSAAKDLMA